jgi:hypothetical protein
MLSKIRVRDIHIPVQIAPVNEHAAEAHSEKTLPQGHDPCGHFAQLGPVRLDQIFYPFEGAGKGQAADEQHQKQTEKQGHGHLVTFFQPLFDSGRHKNHGQQHGRQMPGNGRGGSGQPAEQPARIDTPESAEQGKEEIFENPAQNDDVENQNPEKSRHRDGPKHASDHGVGRGKRLHECPHGTGLLTPTKGQFGNEPEHDHAENEQEIGHQKGGPAIGSEPPGKEPDISQPDGRAHARQDKPQFAAPVFSFHQSPLHHVFIWSGNIHHTGQIQKHLRTSLSHNQETSWHSVVGISTSYMPIPLVDED